MRQAAGQLAHGLHLLALPQPLFSHLQLGAARLHPLFQGQGQLAQLVFGQAPLGHVRGSAEPFGDLAVAVQQRHRAHLHPAHAAIGEQAAVFQRQRLPLRQRAGDGLLQQAQILRMYVALLPVAERGQAVVLRDRSSGQNLAHLAPVGGDRIERLRGGAHQRAEASLAMGQCIAGAALFCPVAQHLDEAQRGAIFIAQHGHGAAGPEPPAGFARQPALTADPAGCDRDALVVAQAVGQDVLLGIDPLHLLAQHLGLRPAEDVLGTGIPQGHVALQVRGDDRVVAGTVDDLAIARLHLPHRALQLDVGGDIQALHEHARSAAVFAGHRLEDEIQQAPGR